MQYPTKTVPQIPAMAVAMLLALIFLEETFQKEEEPIKNMKDFSKNCARLNAARTWDLTRPSANAHFSSTGIPLLFDRY